jgi:hypothetical protein
MRLATIAGLALSVASCAPTPFACAEQALMASIASQNRVKKQMRDPDSTEFDMSEARASMISEAPCRWRTYGLGRSRNGFGGVNLFRYKAQVDFTPDGNSWTVSNIEIADGG